jgi:hypothetical protein
MSRPANSADIVNIVADSPSIKRCSLSFINFLKLDIDLLQIATDPIAIESGRQFHSGSIAFRPRHRLRNVFISCLTSTPPGDF